MKTLDDFFGILMAAGETTEEEWDAAIAEHDARRSGQPKPQPDRETLEWAGIKALVESADVPTGVRGVLLGEVFTIREAVDADVVVRAVLDALLPLLGQPRTDAPRTVTAVEELDALPVGSLVLADGEVYDRLESGWWRCLNDAKAYREWEKYPALTVVSQVGAATVIREGE